MSPLVERLAAKAFHRANVEEANRAIDAARELRSVPGQPALSYEVVLPDAPFIEPFLLTRTLPKLVYFLDCRGAALPDTPRVFVSLFTAEGLFFIEAGAVVQELASEAGLGLDELVRRYGSNGQGDPLLLGG